MARSKRVNKAAKKPSKKRKAAKAAESTDDIFYVQVHDQRSVKINILESMKLVIRLMKEYENYMHVKHQKESAIYHLKIQFKEISKLAGILKSKLPLVDIKEPKVKRALASQKEPGGATKKPKEKIPKEVHKEEPLRHPSGKENGELEKLESELAAIEHKLRGLE